MKQIISITLLLSSISGLGAEKKDDEQVSTMNGQLVEVGNRNRYQYDAPKINLSVNPFGIISQNYSVSASFGLTSIASVRGEVSYDEKNSGFEMSLGSQIFFRKLYSGVYMEPGLVRRDQGNIFGPQVLLGYNWFWDSGMNISLAAGIGRNLNDSRDDQSEGETFANGYFKVGYAF